jgi:hypothetical protein
MTIALWITAGLLAAVALVGGTTKTFVPKARLAAQHGGEWTANASAGFVKTLGVLELLGRRGSDPARRARHRAGHGAGDRHRRGSGGSLPRNFCWILLMIGAMITHARLGQPKLVGVNAVYLALAAFIAVGSFAA